MHSIEIAVVISNFEKGQDYAKKNKSHSTKQSPKQNQSYQTEQKLFYLVKIYNRHYAGLNGGYTVVCRWEMTCYKASHLYIIYKPSKWLNFH